MTAGTCNYCKGETKEGRDFYCDCCERCWRHEVRKATALPVGEETEGAMNELKPCPFCGAKNTDDPAYPLMRGHQAGRVSCDACGASAHESIWNTRADEAALRDAFEAGQDYGSKVVVDYSPHPFHGDEMVGKMRKATFNDWWKRGKEGAE
jgi:hypothetical protein